MWKYVFKKYSSADRKKLISGIRDWKWRAGIVLKWLEGTRKNIKILDCGCGIGNRKRMENIQNQKEPPQICFGRDKTSFEVFYYSK